MSVSVYASIDRQAALLTAETGASGFHSHETRGYLRGHQLSLKEGAVL